MTHWNFRDSIKSVDKTVRILCDYYMSRIKAADIEAAKATSKATTGGGEVAEGGEVKTGAQVEEVRREEQGI